MGQRIAATLVLISLAVPARALDVTTCGALIAADEVGTVQADFDCVDGPPDNPYFGIVLQRGARLDLNGHVITFRQNATTIAPVYCESSCEVHGPGTLVSSPAGGAGIWANHGRRVSIQDLDISGFTTGIVAPRGRLALTNVSIDATNFGIVAARRLELDHVDVILPGGPFGIAGRVGECIGATQPGGRVTGSNVSVTGCQHGVYGTSRVQISALSVSASYIGVFSAGTTELTDSTVTGSEYADLYSGRPPVLVNTTCDHSLQYHRQASAPAGPWGVCAND